MIIDHDHNNDHNHDHDNYHDHNYFGEFYELEEGFSILSWFKLYYFTTQLGNYLIPISVVILFIQLTCYWKSESKEGPGEPWRHFWFPSSSSSSSNLSSSSRSVAEAQLSSLLAACCLRVLRLKFAEYSNYNTGSRLLTPFFFLVSFVKSSLFNVLLMFLCLHSFEISRFLKSLSHPAFLTLFLWGNSPPPSHFCPTTLFASFW